MKLSLVLLCLVFTQAITAQNFEEAPQNPPFTGVDESSIAFADIDGDSDLDLLISGMTSGIGRSTRLYVNDGSGNFSEVEETPFEAVAAGSVAFADVDGDDDQDLIISGVTNSEHITILYINDGAGNFTEVEETLFWQVAFSSVAFADVDGDNDQDVMITGSTVWFFQIALYINDGAGNFTELLDTPFDAVNNGSIAFADVDGDNDPDVLITGQNDTYVEYVSTLYINDGLGNFSEVMDTPFEGVMYSTLAFADVDGDNDQDVLISGLNTSLERVSHLYLNDGAGNFIEALETPFAGTQDGSIAFADIDGDGDQDVLVTGWSDSGYISKLYSNDGAGVFTEVMNTPFDNVGKGSVAFADVDGDNDQDLMLTGEYFSNPDYMDVAKLYINNGVPSSVNDGAFNSAKGINMLLYPNPVVSEQLFVRYQSTQSGSVIVSVHDVRGQLISQQNEFAVTGEQNFEVNTASLTSGSYFLKLESAQETGTARFMVH